MVATPISARPSSASKESAGATRVRSKSAATVTSLKVEPGSYTCDTLRKVHSESRARRTVAIRNRRQFGQCEDLAGGDLHHDHRTAACAEFFHRALSSVSATSCTVASMVRYTW